MYANQILPLSEREVVLIDQHQAPRAVVWMGLCLRERFGHVNLLPDSESQRLKIEYEKRLKEQKAEFPENVYLDNEESETELCEEIWSQLMQEIAQEEQEEMNQRQVEEETEQDLSSFFNILSDNS